MKIEQGEFDRLKIEITWLLKTTLPFAEGNLKYHNLSLVELGLIEIRLQLERLKTNIEKLEEKK